VRACVRACVCARVSMAYAQMHTPISAHIHEFQTQTQCPWPCATRSCRPIQSRFNHPNITRHIITRNSHRLLLLP